MKQSYIEIFDNEGGNITLRYALPEGEQLEVQTIAIHEDDIAIIADGLLAMRHGE